MNPRPLSIQEQQLIDLYSRCQLGMTPQQFYAKWQVSQEGIALICQRSPSTVQRWFSRGGHYRRPTLTDMRHLALMDFLLEHFTQIPPPLWELLCVAEFEQP
jgi:hypothetical protein